MWRNSGGQCPPFSGGNLPLHLGEGYRKAKIKHLRGPGVCFRISIHCVMGVCPWLYSVLFPRKGRGRGRANCQHVQNTCSQSARACSSNLGGELLLRKPSCLQHHRKETPNTTSALLWQMVRPAGCNNCKHET